MADRVLDIHPEAKDSDHGLGFKKILNRWKNANGITRSVVYVVVVCALFAIALIVFRAIFTSSVCSTQICYEESAKVLSKMNHEADP